MKVWWILLSVTVIIVNTFGGERAIDWCYPNIVFLSELGHSKWTITCWPLLARQGGLSRGHVVSLWTSPLNNIDKIKSDSLIEYFIVLAFALQPLFIYNIFLFVLFFNAMNRNKVNITFFLSKGRARCSHFMSACYLAATVADEGKRHLGVPCTKTCKRIRGLEEFTVPMGEHTPDS